MNGRVFLDIAAMAFLADPVLAQACAGTKY